MFPPWLQALTPSTTGLASQFPQYRIDIGPAGGAVPASVSVSRATSKITNLGATTATVGNNVGSIESAGLVIEPAHTNLAIGSSDMSLASRWTVLGNTLNPLLTGGFADPAGGTTAVQIRSQQDVDGSGGSYSIVRPSAAITISNSTAYTFSVWLKAGTTNSCVIYNNDGASVPVTCSLTSSWQRFSVTHTSSSTSGYPTIGWFGSAFTVSGKDIYAWMPNLTAGSVTESAVSTTTVAAACNADVVTDSGTSSLPVATGTIYATFTPEWATANAPGAYLVDTRAGTPGTTVGYAFYVDSSGKLSFKVGAQTAVQSSALTWVAGTTYTVRATWASGTITLYQSGTQVATSGSNSMPTSNSATHVGCDSSGANQLTGRLASLIFYGA
jgi:hypothetical protein